MKSTSIRPTTENIRTAFINDSLNRNEDVGSFVSILNSIEGRFCLALDGGWGTGKTFFIKQAKMILDAYNPFSKMEAVKQESIKKAFGMLKSGKRADMRTNMTVYYDAWSHDQDEDPLLSIVYEIAQCAEDRGALEGSHVDLRELIGGLIEVLTGRNLNRLLDSLAPEDLLKKMRESRDIEDKIKSFIKNVKQEEGERLVLFIDELDRCKPDYAIRLLERVKHYFDIDDTIFVFSLNTEQLQHSIKAFYGTEMDACRYLDRFFDLRISIPQIDVNRIMLSHGLKTDYYIYDLSQKVVIQYYNFGLREISRYVATCIHAAGSITHKNYSEPLFSQQEGLLFCVQCLVPILIGVRMVDISDFNELVDGKNDTILAQIIRSDEELSDYCIRLLTGQNTVVPPGGEIEIIKKFYKAVFIDHFRGGEEERFGKMTINERTKNVILKIINLLSEYADYT